MISEFVLPMLLISCLAGWPPKIPTAKHLGYPIRPPHRRSKLLLHGSD